MPISPFGQFQVNQRRPLTQDGGPDYVDPGQPAPTGNNPPPTSPFTGKPITDNTNTNSGPSWVNDPQYASMDPALKQIYINAGQTPEGRGTGFADWQYWQGVGSSQYGRLAADIAGTGSDQTTGTPWESGPWQNSGRNAKPAGGGGSLSAATVSPFAAPAYQPSQVIKDPRVDQLYGEMQGLIKQSTDVSPNDPVIKAQTDAYRAEQTRAARDAMSNQAEAAGPNANLDASKRLAFETAGTNTSNFQATAMVNELSARRQQIMQALNDASGLLTAEQQMSLQEELGNLNAALSAWSTKSNLDVNESQFGRNLAQQAFQFDSNMYNNVFGG